MRKKNILLVLAAFVCPLILEAQDERKITLGEAIALARTQSVDAAVALNELKKQAADWSFYDSSYVNELLEYFPHQKKGLERDFALIGNPESTTKQIQSEISRFRNKPITKAIDPLLNIIKNESQEEELRIAAAETLGWYNLYHDKTSIIKELETFQTSKKKVMNEIVKTINRLKGKNR